MERPINGQSEGDHAVDPTAGLGLGEGEAALIEASHGIEHVSGQGFVAVVVKAT